MSMPNGTATGSMHNAGGIETQSLNRARFKHQDFVSSQGQDNLYKYRVEEHLVPKKQVPILLPNGQTKYTSPPKKNKKRIKGRSDRPPIDQANSY